MPSRSLSYAKIIQLLINTKLKEVKPTYLVLTQQKSSMQEQQQNPYKSKRQIWVEPYTRNFPHGVGNSTP